MHHRPPGNCNYAGVLIIWDKMFGTFREELVRKDFYGLAQQLNSYNPLYANYAHLIRMLNIDMRGEQELELEKNSNAAHSEEQQTFLPHFLRVFFRRRVNHPIQFDPGNILSYPIPLPQEIHPGPSTRTIWGTLTPIHPIPLLYCFAQFVTGLAMSVCLLMVNSKLNDTYLLLSLPFPIYTLLCVGLICDNHPRAKLAESFRVCLAVFYLLLVYPDPFSSASGLISDSWHESQALTPPPYPYIVTGLVAWVLLWKYTQSCIVIGGAKVDKEG